MLNGLLAEFALFIEEGALLSVFIVDGSFSSLLAFELMEEEGANAASDCFCCRWCLCSFVGFVPMFRESTKVPPIAAEILGAMASVVLR
jgi:hypothetical protein